MRALLMVLFALPFLFACTDYRADPQSEILDARFTNPAPSSVTLLTVVSLGGTFTTHSALLINASQQVLYDPGGSFRHPDTARASDVNYGMTPKIVADYKSYHARVGHFVMAQKLELPAELAEELLRRAQQRGATAFLWCTVSTSWVLRGLEMFAHIPITHYPEDVAKIFAQIPGVETSYTIENDRVKAF